DPIVRQRLARAHIGLEIMRLNALRTLAGSESGTLGRAATVGKLYWATVHRDLGELAMDVLGPAATVCPGAPGGGYDPGPLQRLFLFSRADTIYGGSNQIQRNIIGERALGLPKEPR
ncbi:MAG TPA: acyl-CoA dehydrogenase family protein, partial [Acidimicrobiales bacterium]